MANAYFEGFEERRARVKILILGSYADQTQGAMCEERLVSLRRFLNSVGYLNVRLVSDFPDVKSHKESDPAYFEMKSKEKITQWATGLIFVFMLGCRLEGVADELTFVDATVPNLFHSSAVFKEDGVTLSRMTEGPLVRHEIMGGDFHSDAHLKELALGSCLIIMRRNYWQI